MGVGSTTLMATAFDEFYERRWPDAGRWAAALTGRVDIGEELAQDVFIRLLPVFDDVERPDAYLYAGIANAARSWHRSEGRRRGREGPTAMAGAVDGGPVDELLGSLRRLPFEQRAVVVLRYWLDWDEADIAATLRCRPSTVRTRAKRGLARLRALLEDDAHG